MRARACAPCVLPTATPPTCHASSATGPTLASGRVGRRRSLRDEKVSGWSPTRHPKLDRCLTEHGADSDP
jgi:hypothetical protein